MPKVPTPIQAVVRPLSLALHEVEVALHLPGACLKQPTVVTLPAWTPGSYLVRDYARFLDRLVCRDAEGREVPLEKVDKQSWCLPALPRGATLTYRLFCNDLTVRTNHVDARHAFLVGAATFLYVDSDPGRPWEVRFEGWPEDWEVATALPSVKGAWHAADHDTLVDSPFELGRFTRHRWTQQGTAFEFVVTGEHTVDEARILVATQRIIDVHARMFGGLPFDRYVFLLTLSPGARGGLEHRESTALLADPFRIETVEGFWDLLVLIAHEFYHAWNVKRLRAVELGPFHYAGEHPTRLLWFHEGVTSFLEWVLVLKAGVVPLGYALRELARLWTDNTTRAGRLEQSLEASSFDAWIRLYKPSEWSLNSTVSYYDRGALVAWMLDARLRLATGGVLGLEDLVVELWRRIGDGILTDEAIQAAYSALALEDPRPFWEAWIQGTAELDSRDIETAYGLVFRPLGPLDFLSVEEAQDPRALDRAQAWTGLTLGADGRVQNVHPGSPAAEAGLSYGMELLAVDGWRVTGQVEALRRFSARGTGEVLEVLAVDRGRVGRYAVRPVPNPTRITRIELHPAPTAEQVLALRRMSTEV